MGGCGFFISSILFPFGFVENVWDEQTAVIKIDDAFDIINKKKRKLRLFKQILPNEEESINGKCSVADWLEKEVSFDNYSKSGVVCKENTKIKISGWYFDMILLKWQSCWQIWKLLSFCFF